MLYALSAVLPWILLAAYMGLRIREPRVLPARAAGDRLAARASADRLAAKAAPDQLPGFGRRADPPFVSVVVPARNEARNIVACLETLSAQDYPAFEILVVDDRSEDGTARLARMVHPGGAREIRVIRGEPLPEGWFGKPWACFQGAREARGRLLLFTDADTRHAPDLLARCVAGLLDDDASALSPVGRQEMGSFGERLVQPHMFALLGLRYPFLDRPVEPGRWRDAILSGQYTLVWKEAYESIGGHAAVKGEVVEDLRLGQELVRAGHRISLRGAGESFSTRMYHSLGELVDGWSKNVATGARQATGPLAPVAVPAGVVFVVVAWILPPLVLAAAGVGYLMVGASGPRAVPMLPDPTSPVTVWAAGATAVGVALWIGGYRRFGAPVGYALLYPLGAGVAAFIFLRSWVRGDRKIEWKGRTYSRGTVMEGGAGEGNADDRAAGAVEKAPERKNS